jgi:hypothetical protein
LFELALEPLEQGDRVGRRRNPAMTPLRRRRTFLALD